MSDLPQVSKVTRSEIIKALNNVNYSVLVATNNFPQIVAKKCCQFLIELLLFLFYQSVFSGVVPSIWMKISIRPIFEAGDKNWFLSRAIKTGFLGRYLFLILFLRLLIL